MSNLLNRIVSNLATRMMLIIFTCIILITSFFIIFSYYNELRLQEERQYDKLRAIVSSAAIHVNGDEHTELLSTYSQGDSSILNDSRYQKMSESLQHIVSQNNLSPMYTLYYDVSKDAFYYGVRSDDYLDFKNEYKQTPPVLKKQYKNGGIIPKYQSENGTWLSAFYPIHNSKNEVIAVVEADVDFTQFIDLVNAHYFQELLVALAVILVLALILIPYARRVLKEDEKNKALLLHQKDLIEAKNRDIMDSIQYSLRIQKSILPSLDIFAENKLEGFVFHEAKDVVAGDFYWIERHDNYLYFAVADCTGHGVPGAIMSLICSNALNRAVDVMKLRDTNLILNAARKLIKTQLGKGGETVKDGMDIALCRLDLKSTKLQFTGANNPIYIYEQANSNFTIAKPCKQPVGSYVKEKEFECQSYQLQKGDLIYLFTDGYADQFGGKNGKKLKYKPFRALLEEYKNYPMQDQEVALRKFLKNWKADFEQVDDICVMGVKV